MAKRMTRLKVFGFSRLKITETEKAGNFLQLFGKYIPGKMMDCLLSVLKRKKPGKDIQLNKKKSGTSIE